MNQTHSKEFEKVDIFPTTVKTAVITAGALYLYNKGVESKSIKPFLEFYRNTLHKFMSFIGGKNFKDDNIGDAAMTSLIDFFALVGTVIVMGRTPLGAGIEKLQKNVTSLFEGHDTRAR